MILNDFTVPKTKYSNEQLDAVLVELCEIILEGKQDNPDFYGSVSAAVIDPAGRLVTGLNYVYGDYRVHAERAAVDKYEAEYGELPKGSIVVTTLSPCSDRMDSRYEESCADLLNSKGVKVAYCGYKDPTQENTQDKFVTIITENAKLKALCKKFADTFLKPHIDENFADGKVKGKSRPGRVKKAGASCSGSVTDLRRKAKNSSGERAKMYHWCANMKSGKKKTNEVIYHNNIKPKHQDTSGLVNRGKPVPPGKEQKLLGTKVGRIGAYEVYKWDDKKDSAYSVYDPKTRISQMTISGHNKPHAFEIFGIYAGPQAPIRAADLYAWLVKNQGLTLVSDKYQSPGGQRVWQDLEQRYGRSVNVHAFNMRTNEPINTGADDPESTHGYRGDIAQNVRLVASPK
jgi:pyrimidine deaminase RibD-like protein